MSQQIENTRRHSVSLFSGAMGLDLGLEQSGFTPVVCNEIDLTAVATIQANRPKLPVIAESVETIGLKELSTAAGMDIHGIDLLSGGPPCQAFSVFGQRQGIKDVRGRLVFEFVRLVSEIQPKAFIMENVRGLHSMPISAKAPNGTLLAEITRRFSEIGYRVDSFLVNAVNYGAPQIRERLILIGNRFNLPAKFPEPEFSNRQEDLLPPFRTLADAIGDGFIDPDPSMMQFSERKLKYLAMVPPGGNWRSLPINIQMESMGKTWHLKGGRSAYWRKLSMDFPCPTVVTMPNHAGTSMCHPSKLRAITVGEMAAIQEFPREWSFVGSPTDKCRQIGNAVPVRLGTIAGEVLQRLLKDMKHKRHSPPDRTNITHVRPHVRTRTFFKAGKVYAGSHSYYQDAPTVAQPLLFGPHKGWGEQ